MVAHSFCFTHSFFYTIPKIQRRIYYNVPFFITYFGSWWPCVQQDVVLCYRRILVSEGTHSQMRRIRLISFGMPRPISLPATINPLTHLPKVAAQKRRVAGYARVSTKEQHLDMQLEALKAAGCEKIFSEKMTGRQQNRPELDACLSFLREGDTLVVYKLDRLGRSLKNILTLLEDFKNRGIQFTSLQDNISTEGAIGQLMNNILGAFAQFERDLIYERTQEGRRIAKEKGVKFGRKTLINKNNIAKQKSCIQLYESGTPVREIQKILNIGSSGTVYRLLRRNGIALKSENKNNK